MKELLFLLGATAGKSSLITLLLKIKTDEDDMANILKSAHAGFKPLQRLVAQTAGKVDDAFVNAVVEAIEEVAAIKGVVLP